MKLFQGRISENMGIQNPFTMLKDWFNSPGIEAIEEAKSRKQALGADPDLKQQIRKQDRVTRGDAAYARKYAPQKGVEQAAKQERIKCSFRNMQGDLEDTSSWWVPGDAWTTQKFDRVARARKRNKPTPSDVMDDRRYKAANPNMIRQSKEEQVRQDVRVEHYKRENMAASRRPLGSPPDAPPGRSATPFDIGKAIEAIIKDAERRRMNP